MSSSSYYFKQCGLASALTPRQIAGAVATMLFILGALYPHKVQATGEGAAFPGCSSCPLTYAPVVDVATGLPFFNECLARCRPGGDTAVHVPAGQRRAGGAGGRAEPYDFFDVLRVPSDGPGSANRRRALAEQTVGPDTVRRYADQGYVYVGRVDQAPVVGSSGGTGLVAGTTATKNGAVTSQSVSTKGAPVASHMGSSPKDTGAASRGGKVLAMRVVAPEGDVYMRVLTPETLKAMTEQYTKDPAYAQRTCGYSSNSGGVGGSGRAPPPVGGGLSTSSTAPPSPKAQRRRRPPPPRPRRNRLNSNATANPNGTINGTSFVFDGESRRELTGSGVVYPLTAVAYVSYKTPTATNGTQNDSFCSGSLVGMSGRMVLTAGECLYSSKGFLSTNIRVALGRNSAGTPYGWNDVDMSEVYITFKNTSDLSVNFGLLRLSYHLSPNPSGSIGFGATCGSVTSLNTAGYSIDKPDGSMWFETFSMSDDVCTAAGGLRRFRYDAGLGMSGAPLWTADNNVRYVASGLGFIDGNGAAPITPTVSSWILNFQDNNIETPPPVVLYGGMDPRTHLYLYCRNTTQNCVGTTTRSRATPFYAYPIAATDRFALQMQDTSLCLKLYGRKNGKVALSPCNEDLDFTFAANELWRPLAVGSAPALQSVSGGYLSCGGNYEELQATEDFVDASAYYWRMEPASNFAL